MVALRLENTLDLFPEANGTALTAALTDRGGDRVAAIVGTAANLTFDTSKKLTPNARGSVKIETAAGVTTQGGMAFGNLDDANGGFDYVTEWGTAPTTTCIVGFFYDAAGTPATCFRFQRVSGGGIQLLDKAIAVIAGTPTGAVFLPTNGPIRVKGRIKAGTTTANGHFDITFTRISDGVVLFTWSSDTVNTGIVNVRQLQLGKLTSTGAAGTGVQMWLQDVVWEGGITTTPTPVEIFISDGLVDLAGGTGASNLSGKATDEGPIDTYDPQVYVIPARSPNMGRPVKATEYLRHPDPNPGMGPMNTFAKDYVANRLAAGRRLLLVPAAYGGTGFTLPDSNGGSMTWLPSAAHDANNRFDYAVSAINAALALGGAGSKLVAILHNAGSTDGSNNVPKETYRGYLLELINGFRSAFGNVPFVMMQSRPSLIAAETRHRIIDEVQQETAGIRSGFTIKKYVAYTKSPDGAQYNMPDAVHFNAAGQRVIGHRMYSVYTDALDPSDNATFYWDGSTETAVRLSTWNGVSETQVKTEIALGDFPGLTMVRQYNFETGINPFLVSSQSDWGFSDGRLDTKSLSYLDGASTTFTTAAIPAFEFTPGMYLSCWVRMPFADNPDLFGIGIGLADATNASVGFRLLLDSRNGTGTTAPLQIRKGNSTQLGSSGITRFPAVGEWLRLTLEYQASRVVVGRAYDVNGVLLGIVTAADDSIVNGRAGIIAYKRADFDDFQIWAP